MKVCCPRCRGIGQTELQSLSKSLRECYVLMKNLGPATREEIHAASKLSGELSGVVTRTYKRVERLERLGLVKPLGTEKPVKFQVL